MQRNQGNSPYSTRAEREREAFLAALRGGPNGLVGNVSAYAPPRGVGDPKTPQENAANLLSYLEWLHPGDPQDLDLEDRMFRAKIQQVASFPSGRIC